MNGRAIAAVAGLVLGATHDAAAQDHFQQRVDYAIEARLDDKAHMLRASERFTYTNNSPRALDTLWIHLWPNAYRDRSTALCAQLDGTGDLDLHFAEEQDRGWIDSLDFRSGGSKLAWGPDPLNIDIAWLALPQPLAPGASITIGTPFRVKIPHARFSRLGHIGQAYYITQWYPKPAVYDREGWHPMPYLTQGEFYSEFGSFDVSITLPANYVVGATGEMLDGDAEKEWMVNAHKASDLPPLVKGIRPAPRDSFPASSPEMKTLRFKQDDVHDFAWIADKRFLVDRKEVKLDRSGRTVIAWALYTPQNRENWKEGVDHVAEALRHYSNWVGDYPYGSCTAVDGTIAAGGGMEYPMITIIGGGTDGMALDEVITHEVGHNWFFGILASNEREHPWMDEGVNSFCELRYMRERYSGDRSVIAEGIPAFLFRGKVPDHRAILEMAYRLNARRNLDQAPGLASEAFTSMNYGTCVYMKTALAFDHLFAYLGAQRFDACMRVYYDKWHHKHPAPADMKAVFEEISEEDLDWFFDDLIGGEAKVDARAVRLKEGVMKVELQGAARMPFPVTSFSGTDTLATRWTTISEGNNFLSGFDTTADRLRIDAEHRTLDIDHRNNEVRTRGLRKRGARGQLRFLTGIEPSDRRATYWTPALGYNAHDGFMVGLALHNHQFPSQRFEYALMPLYGTSSGRAVGGARAVYHFDRLRSGPFRNVHIGVSFQSFSAYNEDDVIGEYEKWTPHVKLDLRRDLYLPTSHSFTLRPVIITERTIGELDGEDIGGSDVYYYEELRYDLAHPSGLSPFFVNASALVGQAFVRTSVEGRWSRIYDKQRHRITFRGFGGHFVQRDDELMEARMGWRYHLGASDLLYDHLFFNRQPIGTLTDQQITKDQGGFKTPNSLGTSDTWIAAVNMELDAPFALPLSLFASAGASPVKTVTQGGTTTSTEFQYEGGIGIRLIRDMAEVWIPLFASEDINDQLDLLDYDFLERIRFVFAIEKLDPTGALRNLAP